MRTIRNFVVLTILLLFLTDAAPIHAVDSLFTVPGCNDITKPCATTGDGVNTVIPLNKTETIIANTAAKLLGPQNIITQLFGSLRPLDSYRIGSQNLTSFANQVQNASDFELNPAALQTIEQHDETSKSASMTSRECVYDPKTGVLVADIVSSDTVITGDVPWIRPAVEGSRRLSSFTTGFVQESQDYRLPDITIKQDAALPCGSQLSGQTKKQDPVSFQFQNTYGSAGTNKLLSFIYTVTADMIKLFTNENGETQAKAEIPATARIVGTGQSPFTGHAAALSAGCAASSDLSAVSYATDEQKKKLCAAGGFVNSMYRQDFIDPAYKSDLNAKDETQQWEQTITGGKPVAANSNAFAARVEAAGTYTNCTLTQADYQHTIPDGACNTNWTNATTSTGGGWNCNTSVPPQSVPGLDINAQASYVERLVYTCPDAKENAWKQCANDVIARSKKACVDPMFTLAIWLHESTASNYKCTEALHNGALVQDFGINGGGIPPEDFSKQLDKFLLLPGAYGSRCPKTLRDFFSQYGPSIGETACYTQRTKADQVKVDDYVRQVQEMYTQLGGGTMKWPQSGCGK